MCYAPVTGLHSWIVFNLLWPSQQLHEINTVIILIFLREEARIGDAK